MQGRLRRVRLVVPRLWFVLLGAFVVVAVAVAVVIVAVRWAHHVAAFAEIALIVAAGLLALVLVSRRWASRIGQRTILEVDLDEQLEETSPAGPLPGRGLRDERKLTLREVLEVIQRASRDGRVVALFARIGRSPIGLARVQELRDAILAFRASGKRAVAFSETFGESSPGNGFYYLATAFDEIMLQPSGDVNVTGIMASAIFLRGTLEKLGVTPRLDHRHEYKTAMNLLTETGFTAAHRESVARVVESQFDQIVRGISEGRGIPKAEVLRLIDGGPFLGREALQARLVDRLAYRDEVVSDVKARAGDGAQLLYLSRYATRTRRARQRGDTVALILGVGTIRRGRSGGNSFDERWRSMGSDTVAAAFRRAVADNHVKAIVFRVDSPGGSYVASDTIWRETVRAREAGKPVIVTMGNVAGSGGYFVAMAADKIVAQPGTITGSIGVFGGKVVTAGLRAKAGISMDEIHTSANATMWSNALDYTPGEWEKVQVSLDRAYEDFTTKVVAGRGLTSDAVREAARGRIWTGEDAKRLGLVDELGGYVAALMLVRQAIGRPAEAPLRIKLFPRPVSLFGRLRPSRAESSEDIVAPAPPSAMPGLEESVDAVVRLTADTRFGDRGLLTMPTLDFTL
jgi:protease IV